MDMAAPKYTSHLNAINAVLDAATQGDVQELALMKNSGVDVFCADYDGRTAMHLAASEGQIEVLQLLVEYAEGDQSKLWARDRWSGTPLGDAKRGQKLHPDHIGFQACVNLLVKEGGVEDSRVVELNPAMPESDEKAGLILTAAAEGDLTVLVHLACTGYDLFCCDYDARTALHLAASNGRLEVIKYLIAQMRYSHTMATVVSQSQEGDAKSKAAGSELWSHAQRKAATVIRALVKGRQDRTKVTELLAGGGGNIRLTQKRRLGSLSSVGNAVMKVNRSKKARLRALKKLISPEDRFLGTPLLDAGREGHTECEALLIETIRGFNKALAMTRRLSQTIEVTKPPTNGPPRPPPKKGSPKLRAVENADEKLKKNVKKATSLDW